MEDSNIFTKGILAKFAKISPILLASTLAFGADYQGDLADPISETQTGASDVFVTYAGGTLNPAAGDALSVAGTSDADTGNIYIGYSDSLTERALTGLIVSAENGISATVVSETSSIFISNAAGINSGTASVYAAAFGGNVTLANKTTGALSSTYADVISLSNAGNGNVSVTNEGTLRADAGSGMNLSSGYGTISVQNRNEITAESNGISATSMMGVVNVDNSARISFNGSYGIYAGTMGTVDLVNTGTLDGNDHSSGIHVSSSVSGGKVVNNGTINSHYAIDIQGSSVRLELGESSDLNGWLNVAGMGNTVAVGSNLHDVDGYTMIGAGNSYELSIVDSSSHGSIHSTEEMTIVGATLFVDVLDSTMFAGEIFVILSSDDVISGTFVNAADKELVYFGENSEYVFEVNYEASRVYLRAMTTVPEPSTCAVLAGLAAVGLALAKRRRK